MFENFHLKSRFYSSYSSCWDYQTFLLCIKFWNTMFWRFYFPSSQPQMYGYDDLQMLQTRFPLVSFVKPEGCLTKIRKYNHKSYFIMACGVFFYYFFFQDYYSIPFAAPTTALTGREGALTSNPYSGKLKRVY